MSEPLLSVQGLSVDFETRKGRVKALEDISFSLARGEILGIVGESGSGKSVLSFAIMGLLDEAARVPSGSRALIWAPRAPSPSCAGANCR